LNNLIQFFRIFDPNHGVFFSQADQLARYSCVGTSLLPMEEHALADWEGTVQSRTKQKLEKLQKARERVGHYPLVN
jgi:hypothetical protein